MGVNSSKTNTVPCSILTRADHKDAFKTQTCSVSFTGFHEAGSHIYDSVPAFHVDASPDEFVIHILPATLKTIQTYLTHMKALELTAEGSADETDTYAKIHTTVLTGFGEVFVTGRRGELEQGHIYIRRLVTKTHTHLVYVIATTMVGGTRPEEGKIMLYNFTSIPFNIMAGDFGLNNIATLKERLARLWDSTGHAPLAISEEKLHGLTFGNEGAGAGAGGLSPTLAYWKQFAHEARPRPAFVPTPPSSEEEEEEEEEEAAGGGGSAGAADGPRPTPAVVSTPEGEDEGGGDTSPVRLERARKLEQARKLAQETVRQRQAAFVAATKAGTAAAEVVLPTEIKRSTRSSAKTKPVSGPEVPR